MSKAEVCVDLFCGVGGFALGSEAAGVPVVLAVDAWPEALAVHAALAWRPPFCGARHECITLGEGEAGSVEAVARLIIEEVAGRPYHLHGSPPCQNLSNANANGDRQEGMRLVLWFIDLVEHLKRSSHPPASWSMEQVRTVAKRLPSWVPWSNLNAADFGVAQTRVRTYAGEGWRAEPTHASAWRSVLDALPHLEAEGVVWMNSGRSDAPTCGVNPRTGKREGGHGPLRRAICEPSYTITSSRLNLEGAGGELNAGATMRLRGYSNTRPQFDAEGNHTGNARRTELDASKPLNQPAYTLATRPLKLIMLGGGNPNSKARDLAAEPAPCINSKSPSQMPVQVEGEGGELIRIRSLTITESLTLQGFPDGFDLTAAPLKGDRWIMVGNAVCPPVAEAVMRGLLNPLETLEGWIE